MGIFTGIVLSIDSVASLPISFDYIVRGLFRSITIVVWSIAFIRMSKIIIKWVSQKDKFNGLIHKRTLPLFDNLAKIVVFIFSIYFVCLSWNIDVTGWVASAGILSVVIGFAAKDTLSNLFAGIFIMADAPYKEGDYINLDTVYNTTISEPEIDEFIKDNEENLKEELIDFSYAKITPSNLIEIDDFNDEFFKKIDDIENLILNGENIDEIVKIYNLQLIKKDNYIYKNENDEILKEIYNNRNKKNTQIIEKNNFYLVYKIKKISSELPDRNSSEFLKFIKNNLYLKNVYEFNQDLLNKIQEKKFKDDDFNEFIKKGLTVEKITINSINDDSIFDINSIKLLYTIPKNNFTLINDKENNIFIAKIIETKTEKILNNSDNFKTYLYKSNLGIKNNLYSSYDLFLNNKYQIKVYRNTLDRIKNYFR